MAVAPVVPAVVVAPDSLSPLRNRVLVITPHGSYRTSAYIQAAQHLNLEVLIASEGEHSIISSYAKGLHIRLNEPEAAMQVMLEAAGDYPYIAVIGTDDISVELAARVARHFNLPHNPPASVQLSRRKDLARQCLQQYRVRIPRFQVVSLTEHLSPQQLELDFPMVIKPLALSGSRGVIRVNNQEELEQARQRVLRILEGEQQQESQARETVLLEQYIPGEEVAVEGMLDNGRLQILTVFDKPDPLEGPYFEETYYITPSRHQPEVLTQLQQTIQAACEAYGLQTGPVHAECRINEDGVWILEVAARTIGGLCARLLTYGTGHSLEELVLSQAMGQLPELQAEFPASGVLMIPTTQAGIFKRVEGLLEAQRIPGIEDIDIQIREGYELVPLPEGASYLGFIFARGDSPQQVEQILRKAYACLNIVVAPLWKIGLAN